MEANELRIGNYVLHYEDQIKLTGITESAIFWGKSSFNGVVFLIGYVKPIPLAEEWLLRAGAEKLDTEFAPNYKLHGFEIEDLSEHSELDLDFSIRIRGNDEHSYLIANVQFVHQLQNFYSSVGKELTIK